MRLTVDQIDTIRATAARVLHSDARVWLFGARVRDDTHGGDIDLLFHTETMQSNRAATLCRLYGASVLGLGNRKIDILLKDPDTPTATVLEVTQRTGVLL